jgi:hypothetical protein
VTPLERFYGLSHAREDQYQGHVRFWDAMGLGMLGPVTAVDAAQPPYGNSRQLSTSVAVGATQDPHGATHASGTSPKLPSGEYRLAPVWRHMFGR